MVLTLKAPKFQTSPLSLRKSRWFLCSADAAGSGDHKSKWLWFCCGIPVCAFAPNFSHGPYFSQRLLQFMCLLLRFLTDILNGAGSQSGCIAMRKDLCTPPPPQSHLEESSYHPRTPQCQLARGLQSVLILVPLFCSPKNII